MSIFTDEQTNDLVDIVDAIEKDNLRKDNEKDNTGKTRIDVSDDMTIDSSVMGSLSMAVTKVNDLCSDGDIVTASIENDSETRRISRELFLMVDGQKVNYKMKTSVPDWAELREKVKKTIDDYLKLIIIKYAQESRMVVTHQNVSRVIVNYSEIGKSWKNDGSPSNQEKLNQVMTKNFKKDKGYEVRIEESVMREHNLSYIDELKGTKGKVFKGCIARMVTRRKVEMVSYFVFCIIIILQH